MFFYFVFVFLITLLIIQYTKQLLYWRRKGIPSPIPLPIVGVGIESFTQNVSTIHFYREKKYGKVFGSFLGSSPILVVNDPKIAKIVTQKEAQNFLDINLLKLRTRFFKDSFMIKTGSEWKNGRNLITPVFTTRKIKDIYPQIKKASAPFFQNIESLIKEGKQDEIEIKSLLKGYSLDVIAKFVFAIELNSAKDKDHPLVIAVKKLLLFNSSFKFILLAILPSKLIEFLGIEFLDLKSLDFVSELCKFLVKQRRESKELKYNDFLDLLMQTIEDKKLTVSQEEIDSYAILFLFAGLETVSMTLCHALYCLILNPECQEKLYNELIDLYPNKEIDHDRLKDSSYLDAVLKESQRMYPALNTLVRIADQSIEINGYKIDAKTAVAIQVINLHYDAEFWGKDSFSFKPERFLVEGFVTENQDEIHFMPFGSGPRFCVAQRYAIVLVKYILAKIILNYEVYRTEKTNVPPKFVKNPSSFSYEQMILGFRRREN